MSNLFGLVKLHGSIMGLLVCDDQVVKYNFYDISYWYEMPYHFLRSSVTKIIYSILLEELFTYYLQHFHHYLQC